MTKEEAKEIFLNRGFVNGLFDGDKWRQSIVVVSKWLEQEPCDCISRQGAIDALGYNISITSDEGLDEYRPVLKEMIEKIYDTQVAQIKALPSIQPKTEVLDKIRADIEQLRADLMTSGGVYEHSAYGLDYAMQIIDKYKAEKE